MNNEELNLVEILKDVPKGTKLYSPIFGDVTFDGINKGTKYCIQCYTNLHHPITFTSKGTYQHQYDGECMIFPSRNNRDWSTYKYVPPQKYEFKPFDKVLVRNYDGEWKPAFFSYYDYTSDYLYVTMHGFRYTYCIPYEGNEHLAFTKNMPKWGEK